MNLIDVLRFYAAEQKRDEEFLRLQGWLRCAEMCHIEGFSVQCNSVWQHPETGKKYPQIAKLGQLKFKRAVEVAEEDLLRLRGWKEVRVRIHDARSQREESWYVNPKSKRMFNRRDAVSIVRDCYNDEMIMCLLTNRLNELVSGKTLKEGDLLCFDYKDGAYELWR